MGERMTAAVAELRNRWRRSFRQLPDVDGIVFGDGQVVLASHYWTQNVDGTQHHFWSPIADVHLADCLKYDEQLWRDVDAWGALELGDQRILFGDGAMGSDGFVAAEDAATGELLWSIFFDWTNPFDQAHLEGPDLVVRSELNYLLRIPLSAMCTPFDPAARLIITHTESNDPRYQRHHLGEGRKL